MLAGSTAACFALILDNFVNKKFLLVIVCALIGFALAALSLHQYVGLMLGQEHSASFCSISEHVDCSRVHTSAWSTFLGKPLASYGLGFYLLMVIISILGLSNKVLPREQSRDFILLSTFLASLSSIALLGISEFIVGALCPVCIAMYCVNFTLFGLAWKMPASEGIFARIGNAFRAGFRLLSIWIPSSSTQGIFSRILTIFGLCIALALIIGGEVFMAHFFIKQQFGPEATVEDAQKAIVSEYVKEWEKQPLVNFNIVRNQVISGDFTKGLAESALQIVEFSDFECPHCQQLGAALIRFAKEFPGAFEVVHKDFPLDSSCNKYSAGMHVGACKAAEFARCGGEQGKFWVIADFFYNSGVPEGKTEREVTQKLFSLCDSFALDEDAMHECMSSGRQLEKIKKDTDLGEALQLQGTPSVWINGKLLSTPHPDVVREIIESSVNQSKGK